MKFSYKNLSPAKSAYILTGSIKKSIELLAIVAKSGGIRPQKELEIKPINFTINDMQDEIYSEYFDDNFDPIFSSDMPEPRMS